MTQHPSLQGLELSQDDEASKEEKGNHSKRSECQWKKEMQEYT